MVPDGERSPAVRIRRTVTMKRLAILPLIGAMLTFAPATSAAGGFVGQWTTIDCATSPEGVVDCGVWGDGSLMALRIGVGEHPRVTFQDFYASSCDNAGSPATHFVGAGRGFYEDIFLFVGLDKTGCGRTHMGAEVEFQFYHDPGSDTLWEDEDGDGWGYIWYRFP